MDHVDEETRKRFAAAASHLPALVPTVEAEVLLQFYGLYKQATSGPCTAPRPSWYQVEAKRKWESWTGLGGMPPEEAIRGYIDLLTRVCPDWESTEAATTGWVSVSTMASNTDSDLDDEEKTVFDHVREGDLDKLGAYSGDPNTVENDESRMTPLHWAADRGNAAAANILLNLGALPNLIDAEGQTALHYAASCGHRSVIELLLQRGADPQIATPDGLRPADMAETDVRATLELSS